MRKLLLALPALALLPVIASAQVVVQTPGVTVVVPPRPAVVVPVSPPPVMVAAKAQSLHEFAATFVPAPTGGRYEVVMQHPSTCCPVKVCFSLPCGCPRKIRVVGNSVEIRYGLFRVVVLRFASDGSVRVRD
jgi:hypothetical protein